MTDVPQVAIDRAIEAGQARKERELDDYGRSTVAGVVDAALPIIAEAAYREGLLKAREIVEALKFPKDWTEYAQGQNETVAAALAVVTGKGASDECPDCGKSQEGGYGPNEELLCGNDFHDLFPDGDPGSGGQR